MIYINRNTVITGDFTEKPVLRAAEVLKRDIQKACNEMEADALKPCNEIRLLKEDSGTFEPECYRIRATEDRLELAAGDTLGFVYGLYAISRELLGITDFWFWNDQKITRKTGYPVPEDYVLKSEPFAVRYRGWFVNDEVLISNWSIDRKKEGPWEMVFEALLRCGGNMTIPGTDQNSKIYDTLASEMGLSITHHHAEPLGAEMFARAYPGLNPSYKEHADLFQKLWQEGIERQKGKNVIWNIGFRGQGDTPFWENDPQYDTDESRGELMSRLIRLQYDLVKESDPSAVCCTNLYGETMELYRKGLLHLPEDVIKIWADNGFGKMVSRRQGNHNPRICALPETERESADQRHGIYYHVSFYDLQAANHITMLPNSPEFVKAELEEVLKRGVKDYWIINCSNVKPHVYYLDFIAGMWRSGTADIERHRSQYVERYYGKQESVAECLRLYHEYALVYGPHEDDHAGEQFSNHVARMLISQFMRDRTSKMPHLEWATDADSLKGQVGWYAGLCKKAANGYEDYLKKCEAAAAALPKQTEVLFRDSILLQAQIHYHCFCGAVKVCESLEKAFAGDYKKAFYLAGAARREYLAANTAMRDREHGKWQGFYQHECLTDVKQTAWVLEGLMSYLRNLGDGPHFYMWQREFLYPEEDKRVMLILNFENHLTDDELFRLMEEKWGE